MDDDRLHDVELELSGLGGERDRQVVADDAEGDLIDHLGNHGIDLSGHDRRAGLARREVDLVQAAARTRREQTQVVAYLRELHGQPLERRGVHDEGARVARGLDHVRRLAQRQSRDFAQVLRAELRIVGIGIDARADGRSAHVDLVEEPQVGLQAVDLLGERCGVGFELLAEGHRHGVL